MLNIAAVGAATEVTLKFISPADRATRWTGVPGGQASFACSTVYPVDVPPIIERSRIDCESSHDPTHSLYANCLENVGGARPRQYFSITDAFSAAERGDLILGR